MFLNIEEIKRLNKAQGRHFFESGAIAAFNSTVYPTVYQGRYFITSESFDEGVTTSFAIRRASDKGAIDTVGGRFKTWEEADKAAKEL